MSSEAQEQRSARPLEGLRVIDIARGRGELAARLLADLGADVIRVERPGERARESLTDSLRNAGKRSLSLDYLAPDGRDLFVELLSRSDFWIESERPGYLAERDLSPQTICEAHPRLIVASISDFGQTGPHRHFQGGDGIGLASGGFLQANADPQVAPLLPLGSWAYDIASITAVFALLAAWLERCESGQGQWLDVSVQEAVASLDGAGVPVYSASGIRGRRDESVAASIHRCRDGWLSLVVVTGQEWQALRAWLGDPEPLRDPALDEFAARVARRAEIEPCVSELLASRSVSEAAQQAQAFGIAATPVLGLAEVLESCHCKARESFVALEVAGVGRASFPAGLLQLDCVRMGPRAGAPQVGEHSDPILVGDLELEPEHFERLAREGVI